MEFLEIIDQLRKILPQCVSEILVFLITWNIISAQFLIESYRFQLDGIEIFGNANWRTRGGKALPWCIQHRKRKGEKTKKEQSKKFRSCSHVALEDKWYSHLSAVPYCCLFLSFVSVHDFLIVLYIRLEILIWCILPVEFKCYL